MRAGFIWPAIPLISITYSKVISKKVFIVMGREMNGCNSFTRGAFLNVQKGMKDRSCFLFIWVTSVIVKIWTNWREMHKFVDMSKRMKSPQTCGKDVPRKTKISKKNLSAQFIAYFSNSLGSSQGKQSPPQSYPLI